MNNNKLHWVVGLMPNDANPQEGPLLYDAWLFHDIKTWAGAHRRAQKYAQAHRHARGGTMRPVLQEYYCSPVCGVTPPRRWCFV